jgi:choice-of-anchor B domain-containing protein
VAITCFIVFGILLCYVSGEKKHCNGSCQNGDDNELMSKVMPLKKKEWALCAAEGRCPNTHVQDLGPTKCVEGYADEYPCSNTDLLSFVSLASLTATGDGNDIWGWTDPQDQREYAIMATFDRSIFVDITEPTNPAVLGFLRTHSVGSLWRDIKVYANHAFIISEARGHGMQVFDLTQLRNVPRVPLFSGNYTLAAPIEFDESAHYPEFSNCHNIAINEESGYAYAVGSNTCRAGLHIIDISDPKNPEFAGCYDEDGYVHDTMHKLRRS